MNSVLLEYLQNKCNLSDKRARDSYEKIIKHKEVAEEFTNYINNGFENCELSIEGFTAKQIYDNYDLSILGAFNYLIALKEMPEQAKEYLEKGLPRK